MKSIEDHIEYDKKIADDPQANPAARRHAKEELHELEEYVEHHKEEIQAGDHHDPNALELFCDMHPDEPECLEDFVVVCEENSLQIVSNNRPSELTEAREKSIAEGIWAFLQ